MESSKVKSSPVVVVMPVNVFDVPMDKQLSELERKQTYIAGLPLDKVIAEIYKERSGVRGEFTLDSDEAAAKVVLEKRKEKKAEAATKPPYTAYEVKFAERITQQEFLKGLFSNNPTNPIIVTKDGVQVSLDTQAYKDAIEAARVSYLENAKAEQSDEFFSSLVEIAIAEGNNEVLDNYLKAIEQKNKKSKVELAKKHVEALKTQIRCKALLKDAEDRRKYRYLIIAGLVIAAFLILAAAIVLTVFVPAVGAVILAAIPVIATYAVTAIKGYLTTLATQAAAALSAGSVSRIGGLLETLFGSRRRSSIEKLSLESGEEVKEAEKEEKEIEEAEEKEKEKIEAAKKAIAAVKKGKEAGSVESDTLKLKGKVSCTELSVVCSHLHANTNPRYHKVAFPIVLIDKENAKIILKALSGNFTVTEFAATYSQAVDQVTKNAIEKQLLINKYLLDGTEPSADKAKELFESIENFKRQAIKKLRVGLDSPESAAQVEDIFKSTQVAVVRRAMKGNKVFRQLSQLPSQPFPHSPQQKLTVGRCIAAFMINPERLLQFLSVAGLEGDALGRKEAQIQQIQQAISGDVFKLQKLGVEGCKALLNAVFFGGISKKGGKNVPENVSIFAEVLAQLKPVAGEKLNEETAKILQEMCTYDELATKPEEFRKKFLEKLIALKEPQSTADVPAPIAAAIKKLQENLQETSRDKDAPKPSMEQISLFGIK